MSKIRVRLQDGSVIRSYGNIHLYEPPEGKIIQFTQIERKQAIKNIEGYLNDWRLLAEKILVEQCIQPEPEKAKEIVLAFCNKTDDRYDLSAYLAARLLYSAWQMHNSGRKDPFVFANHAINCMEYYKDLVQFIDSRSGDPADKATKARGDIKKSRVLDLVRKLLEKEIGDDVNSVMNYINKKNEESNDDHKNAGSAVRSKSVKKISKKTAARDLKQAKAIMALKSELDRTGLQPSIQFILKARNQNKLHGQELVEATKIAQLDLDILKLVFLEVGHNDRSVHIHEQKRT